MSEPAIEDGGATSAGAFYRRHPGLTAVGIHLVLIGAGQQLTSLVRTALGQRGVTLAPTAVGVAACAAATGLHELLEGRTQVEGLAYRTALVTAATGLVAGPLVGLTGRGVVLPRRSPAWGLAVPAAVQLAWLVAFVAVGRGDARAQRVEPDS